LDASFGLVDDSALGGVQHRKRDAVAREAQRPRRLCGVNPQNLPPAVAEPLLGRAIEHEYNLGDLLRRPGIDFDRVSEIAAAVPCPAGAGCFT